MSVSPLQINFSFNCISIVKDSPDTSPLAPELPIAYSHSIPSCEIIEEATSLASRLYSQTETPAPDVRTIWLWHPRPLCHQWWCYRPGWGGRWPGPLPHCSLCTLAHKAASVETLANKQAGKTWSWVSLFKERVERKGRGGPETKF